MADNELATLRSVISRLTAAELRSLDKVGMSWLPSLQKLSLHHAVNKIVGSLQAIEFRSTRLKCIAQLYCWLSPRQRVQPWLLFRLEKASELSDFRRLLRRSASALRLCGHDVTLEWTLEGGAVHSCLLIESLEMLAFEQRAAYVVVWPGLPLLAVHAPERHMRRQILIAVDKAQRGVPIKLLDVPHGDLGVAFRAGLALLGLVVGEGTRDGPTMAVSASPSHVSQDMPSLEVHDEKTRKRLETWKVAMAELGPRLQPVEHSYKITDGAGTWVRFEGPNLMEQLCRLYVRGFDYIISTTMKPAFLGKDIHVVHMQD